MKFLIINGPNLNLMHFTEPGVAGQIDYNALLDYLEVCCQQMDIQVEFFQSNHEGDLIDEIQSAAGRADGIVINPGGYAHYSVAILDALRVCFGCQGHFIGEGISGYLHACAYLVQLLRIDGSGHTHLVM